MLFRVSQVLALVALACGNSWAWPRYQSSMTLELHFPSARPYVALTVAQIERVKQQAAKSAVAKAQVGRVVAQAAGFIANPLGTLRPGDDSQHRNNGNHLLTAALAYAFTGDRRYAEWTRDGLLAYAAVYPGIALTSASTRLFTESLYEASWLVEVAQAYDLVAASGVFTAGQTQRVEDDLLRKAVTCFKIEDFQNDPRIQNLHFRCYNFQAWHVAAVALVGLAVQDRELVDWAINSPYGFRHLVAHDIDDDGMFWERSEGYHEYVLEALVPLAEAMFHCGVDLYHLSVPADRSKDEDAHYMTDTSDRPKSIQMMFESLFYLTFPDLSYPALGDSDAGPLRAGITYLTGYERYHDAKLAWLLARGGNEPRDWRWLLYDLPAEAPASLPLEEGRFANTGEYRDGCSLFPSIGLAVLRQATGDYTRQPDSTAISLSYGPHGGGHGHSDALNLVVYAQGRQWAPDFGSMPYESHWKEEWTAQSVSHNTIVVDGISQKPTGRRNVMWPTDNAADRVFGVLERFDPAAKSASATNDRAYAGIRLRRAVRLDGSRVVDIFSAADAQGATHQYDYVLHIDGQLAASSTALEAASGKLGEVCGYQLVEQKQRGTAAGSFHLTFAHEGKQLRVWLAGEGATEVILGDGLTNSPDRKMTTLVLRRKTPATQFVTVIEPVNAAGAIRSVRPDAAGIVIESAIGTHRVRLE